MPIGQPITVTGMFDHPAAATCERRQVVETVGPFEPTDSCRFRFVVTSIK